MIWLDSRARYRLSPRLKWDQEKKKLLRKHSLHSWFLPIETMWWTDSSTAWRDDKGGQKWHWEPMCRCGCFQGEHGIRRTQGARGLGWWGGGAWRCNDVLWLGVGCQNYSMKRVFFFLIEAHACLGTDVKVTCRVKECDMLRFWLEIKLIKIWQL